MFEAISRYWAAKGPSRKKFSWSTEFLLCWEQEKDNTAYLVPILFTSETVEAIDSLFQYWSEVRIADTNEYIFSREEGEDDIVAWDTLQAI